MEEVLKRHKSRHNTQGKESWKAYISEAGLIAAFLRRVDLSGAKLSGAYPHGVDLSETYLIGADLSEADLMSGVDITEEQIASAIIHDATNIPDYLEAPTKRKKRLKRGTKE